MRRIAVLALAAVACSAFAQTTPPDVPANHWAAKAITDLYRLGVLKGYPDGLYRGNRPATRFEMAQAINGLFQVQKSTLDGYQSQLNDILNRMKSIQPAPQVDVEGLAEVRRRLDALDANVQGLEALRTDVKDLNSQFESLLQDLRKLRADVRGNMRIPRQ